MAWHGRRAEPGGHEAGAGGGRWWRARSVYPSVNMFEQGQGKLDLQASMARAAPKPCVGPCVGFGDNKACSNLYDRSLVFFIKLLLL